MLQKKALSLRYAFQGILTIWQEEDNFKIESVLAVLALVLGWFVSLSTTEWLIVIFLIGFVLSAEALNTALEEFCDMIKGDPDPHIAKIKDLAAAAVLISSLTALVCGAVIFLPKIF